MCGMMEGHRIDVISKFATAVVKNLLTSSEKPGASHMAEHRDTQAQTAVQLMYAVVRAQHRVTQWR